MKGNRSFLIVVASFLASPACAQPPSGPSIRIGDAPHGASHKKLTEGSVLSVNDLLRFATLGDPRSLNWLTFGEASPAIVSPDGAHAAVVVRDGNPETETNGAHLLVYDLASVWDSRSARLIARFESSTGYQPLAFVRWADDGRSLTFAAAEGSSAPAIYRADVRSGKLTRLAAANSGLRWFGLAGTGNRLVTLAESRILGPKDIPECRRYGCEVTQKSLYDAEFGAPSGIMTASVTDFPGGAPRALPPSEAADSGIDYCDPEFAGTISPDGRSAIRLCRLKESALPPSWGSYSMSPMFATAMKARNVRAWRVGVLVDLDSGQPRRWTQAPVLPSFWTAPPIWIDGGRKVVFPAAFEPIADPTSTANDQATSAYSVQVLDIATGTLETIGWLPPQMARVATADWSDATQTLRISGRDQHDQQVGARTFVRSGSLWHETGGPAEAHERREAVEFFVREDMNTPPMLFMRRPATGETRLLLDPNPWLASKDLGHVESIEWLGTDGRKRAGGLFYPPGYQPGRRYPLLIQTHGFDRTRFTLHGAARNFPGRAVGALGIVVLQVDESNSEVDHSPQLWTDAVSCYEGAIDQLDKRHLIDRQKVGIVGWSATGPTAAAMLTHSNYPIAAAAFTDTSVYGLWYYNLGGGSESQHARFGGPPFGSDLAKWLGLSPTLNLQRVRAPLLMMSAEAVGGIWDWNTGLRQLRKPAETWLFPTGAHDVFQASQTLSLNQMLIDWYRFWLLEEERPTSPAYRGETLEKLEAQYARWQALRRLRDEDALAPRPPLLEWHSTERH